MKSMLALEKLIKEVELRIAVSKGQLARHNTGEEKLSLLSESSAENSLDKHIPLLDKYKKLLKDFIKIEKLDSFEHRRLRAGIERKKYYKYHRKVKKKIKYKENDEKIEATMIIDELPEEFALEERELFELTSKNIEQYLIFHPTSESDFKEIQDEFNTLIKDYTDESIKSLELLNYMIPIIIFHFYLFMLNIIDCKNNESEEEITELNFFPKFQDWWITEMWSNDNAYFALFQWKNTITDLCMDTNQKKVWEIIFNNWIFAKSLLCEKSTVAYEYQYIFDTLLYDYVQLESETDESIILGSQKELEEFIKSEDLLSVMKDHHVITPYVEYKFNI
jgi:hypothetical protein